MEHFWHTKGKKSFRMGKHFMLMLIASFAQAQSDLSKRVEDDAREQLSHYAASLNWPPYESNITVWLAPAAEQLPSCTHIPSLEAGGLYREPFGRRPYMVRCNAPVWELRARADVTVTLPVWFSATSLEKGQRLASANLVTKSVEVSRFYREFTPSNQMLEGLLISRRMRAGQLITRHDIQKEVLVHRGNTVIIRAGSDGFEATMQGEALADGSLGDTIKVRNLSSNKEVQAWICGVGEVRTRF